MENDNVKINESLTSNVLDQNRQKKEINILGAFLAALATGLSCGVSYTLSNFIYEWLSERYFNSGTGAYFPMNAANLVSDIISLLLILLFSLSQKSITGKILFIFSIKFAGSVSSIFCYAVLSVYCALIGESFEVTKYTFISSMLSILLCIVFSVIIFIAVDNLFNSQKAEGNNEDTQVISDDKTPQSIYVNVNRKKKSTAALLCFFLGAFGVHRFYTGKIVTGFLWMMTGGFFGIGDIVDFFCIIFGSFKDSNGFDLV